MHIRDRVFVITGGASGLGLATVELLLSQGARVCVWDLNNQLLSPLLQKYDSSKLLFIKINVSSQSEIQKAVEKTVFTFGQINVLVNCAAIITLEFFLYKDRVHSKEKFEEMIRVNLIGTFDTCRFVSRQMAKQKGYGKHGERGVIINVSSFAGLQGSKTYLAYGISKAGVAGMTLPMYRDLSRFKIRVMCIAPGVLDTPMSSMIPQKAKEITQKTIPIKEFGKPHHFAHTVKFITENQYIGGSVLRLDGGIRSHHFQLIKENS